MVTIKLHDYVDEATKEFCFVGMGRITASVINLEIRMAVANGEDISFDINSGGGFVTDGNAIYNCLLDARKSVKVTTINSGLAASIASVVFMAGEERIMAPASLMMIHSPGIDLYGRGTLTAVDLRNEADTLDTMQEVLINVYTSGTKMRRALAVKLVEAETWLTAEKCLTFGLATQIDKGHLEIKATSQMVAMIGRTAPEDIRAHTNRFFNTIKTKRMAKETKPDSKSVIAQAMKMANQFTASITAAFGAPTDVTIALEDGSSVYADADLAVGVTLFEDEELTMPVGSETMSLATGQTVITEDGVVTEIKEAAASEDEATDIVALKAEITALKADNVELQTALSTVTGQMTAAMNRQSNYKPKGTSRVVNHGKNAASAAGVEKVRFDMPPPEQRLKAKRSGVPGK